MSGIGRYFKRTWKRPDGSVVESQFYSISYPFQGKTRVEGTDAQTEAAAKAALKRKLEEIGRGNFALNQDRVTLVDLVTLLKADYRNNANRSLDHALTMLKPVLAFFSGWRAPAITIMKIDEYVDQRLAEGMSIATVNGELRYLRLLFNLGLEKRVIGQSPVIHLLKGENKRDGFIDPGDFERLLSKFENPDVADLVEFLYETGWRVKAACGFTFNLVNGERSTITMTSELSKNKKPLELPYSGRLEAILKRRQTKRRLDCPYVFHRNGKKIKQFRIAWRKAAAEAKVPGLIPHDLCRSVARNLYKAGVREQTAAEFMNRSTPMYRQYNIGDIENLAAARRLLDEFRKGAEPKVEDIEKARKP